MKRIFIFICIFLLGPLSKAQMYVLVPGKGIESPSIVINHSTLDSVIHSFGNQYQKSSEGVFEKVYYPANGFSFSYNIYDKNKIIRSIENTGSNAARSADGIIVGFTTVSDALKLHPGYIDYDTIGVIHVPGICYYFQKKHKRGKLNLENRIIRIAIYSKKMESCINCTDDDGFVYDTRPDKEKRKVVQALLNKPDFSLNDLKCLSKKEEKDIQETYLITYDSTQGRTNEYGLVEETGTMDIGQSYFTIYTLSRDHKLVFMRITEDDTIYFERKTQPDYKQLLEEHKSIYGADASPGDPLLFPLETLEYNFDGLSELVAKKNYTDFAKRLRSFSPEIQASGIDGLYQCKRLHGMDIKAPEQELIDHLKKTNTLTQTYYQVGCIGWYTFQPICDIIKQIESGKVPKHGKHYGVKD